MHCHNSKGVFGATLVCQLFKVALFIQPIDDKNKKELETVLKGFAGKNAVLKLNQKVNFFSRIV